MQTTTHTRLISADKVEGTTVYNQTGDKVGTVANVMIDKLSGKVAYADMTFGGFLGMGDKHHALPLSVLTYSREKDGYVVNLDKDKLENAPSYDAKPCLVLRLRRGPHPQRTEVPHAQHHRRVHPRVPGNAGQPPAKTRVPSWSATLRHCSLALIGSSWAKTVPTKAETTRRPLLPAWASTLRMK
jgi:hypothetical protein